MRPPKPPRRREWLTLPDDRLIEEEFTDSPQGCRGALIGLIVTVLAVVLVVIAIRAAASRTDGGKWVCVSVNEEQEACWRTG